MKQLRRVKFLCAGLALLAIVATTDCRWPISPDSVRVEPAPGNALTYDTATQTVTAGPGKPAFVIDTPFDSITGLVIDITAVDRTISPNYDMVNLEGAAREMVPPVPNGDPARKTRELQWLIRNPIEGLITVYPLESSTFRINGIHVRGRLLQIPLMPILAALLLVFVFARWRLAARARIGAT